MKSKFILSISFLMFLFLHSVAQNLVPNGSFETIDPTMSCPGADGFNLGRPQYWTGYYPPVSTGGTFDLSGDYFYTSSTCNTTGYNYPGVNEAGCQTPFHGQAYCGFLAAATNVGQPVSESEYIMNTNIPLTAGQQYYVEFYVSNAAGKSSNGWPSTAYSKNIGAFFLLTSQVSSLPNNQINGLNNITVTKPQVPNTFPAADYYNRTSNGWQKISGYFTPSTTGTWTMVIGNFDPGMNTTAPNPCNTNLTMPTNPNLSMKSTYFCGDYRAAYYFVDAVTVIPSNQTPPVYQSVLGPNPLCTSPAQYTLQASPFGATSITWSSSNTSGVTINSSSGAATRVNNYNGSVTLTATITDVCASSTTVSKTVWVGKPQIKFVANTCLEGTRMSQYDGFTYSGALNWSITPAADIYRLSPTSAYVWSDVAGSSFTLTLTDPNGGCPNETSVSLSGTIGTCSTGGGGGHNNVIAFPNPASSTLSVASASVDGSGNMVINSTGQSFSAELVDSANQSKKSGSSDGSKLIFDVSDLPKGIYFLRLKTSEGVSTSRVYIDK